MSRFVSITAILCNFLFVDTRKKLFIYVAIFDTKMA